MFKDSYVNKRCFCFLDWQYQSLGSQENKTMHSSTKKFYELERVANKLKDIEFLNQFNFNLEQTYFNLKDPCLLDNESKLYTSVI